MQLQLEYTHTVMQLYRILRAATPRGITTYVTHEFP